MTVIEVVSPTNKYSGPGRSSYLDKQQEIRSSETHLIEIDLLRIGHHVLAVAEWVARARKPYDYLVSANRAGGLRDVFQFYPITLRERLPRIAIPLAEKDPDVRLDFQAVLSQAYDAGRYQHRLRYDVPCRPSLSPEDQSWADQQIPIHKAQGGNALS